MRERMRGIEAEERFGVMFEDYRGTSPLVASFKVIDLAYKLAVAVFVGVMTGLVAEDTDGPLARAMAWSLAGAQAAYALSSTLLFPLTDMLACFFEVVSAWLQAGAMVCAALLASRPQDTRLQAASLWLYIASLVLMVANVWLTVTVKVLLAIKITKRVKGVAEKQGELQRARTLKEAVAADPSLLWRKEAHGAAHHGHGHSHSHWKPEKDWQR